MGIEDRIDKLEADFATLHQKIDSINCVYAKLKDVNILVSDTLDEVHDIERTTIELRVRVDQVGLLVDDNQKIFDRMNELQDSLIQYGSGCQNVFEKYDSLYKTVVDLSVSFKGLRSFVLNCPEMKGIIKSK